MANIWTYILKGFFSFFIVDIFVNTVYFFPLYSIAYRPIDKLVDAVRGIMVTFLLRVKLINWVHKLQKNISWNSISFQLMKKEKESKWKKTLPHIKWLLQWSHFRWSHRMFWMGNQPRKLTVLCTPKYGTSELFGSNTINFWLKIPRIWIIGH